MAEDGVHIDLGELGQELKNLDRAFAAAIRKQVRTAVSEAGAAVLGQARSNASWSSRIPAATKLTTSFSARRAGVTIRTSKTRAPHARPFEKTGGGSSFRHKVFGRDEWVDQQARPYLFPAVESRDAGTNAAFQAAIDKAVRQAGFQ